MERAYETKKRIAEALGGMLKHNCLEDIRVTKLCAKAGVPRRSFYNYFNDIYDIVMWIWGEIMRESVCRIGRDLAWHEGHELMFELCISKNMLFKRNADIYVGNRAARDALLENIRARKKSELSENELVDLDYYAFAVGNVINKWGVEGMLIPPKRMADICQQYIPEWLIDLFGA